MSHPVECLRLDEVYWFVRSGAVVASRQATARRALESPSVVLVVCHNIRGGTRRCGRREIKVDVRDRRAVHGVRWDHDRRVLGRVRQRGHVEVDLLVVLVHRMSPWVALLRCTRLVRGQLARVWVPWQDHRVPQSCIVGRGAKEVKFRSWNKKKNETGEELN